MDVMVISFAECDGEPPVDAVMVVQKGDSVCPFSPQKISLI